MSDQYTRVTCGGSPLSCDAPVVGLLFGKMESAKDHQQQQQAQSQSQQQAASEDGKSSNLEGSGVGGGTTLEIRDAEDIPTEISENTAQQISLHQAVFPQHHVVGWYRVAKKNTKKNSKDPQGDSKVSSADAAVVVEDTVMTPTEQDLLLTKQLQHHYASKDTTTPGGFIFGLLQVPSDEEIANTAQSSSSSSNSGDQLPLSVYQVKTLPSSSSESSASTSFLYALENWQLETSEVERIAVERVVREQPQHHHSTASSKAATSTSTKASTAKAATAAAATDQDDENTSESVISTSSAYATHATSISTSLEAMEQRLEILVEYLQKFNPEREQPRSAKENNEGGETDVPEEESGQVNLEILREIQGLVYQLGAVEAFSEQQQQQQQNGGGQEGDSDALLLSHLGAVAKTVCAIQGYTDKFRTLTESRPISGRDMRRFHH
mmetsp:Transcript_15470/g.21547  ORF Transcript_15470/g.21547 Transcript_15470/m.21547 type:complete len:438 (+) Transcript_15470:29-1342(+)